MPPPSDNDAYAAAKEGFPEGNRTVESIALGSAVVRFAGDSGDGMQQAGGQFTSTSAVVGNDIATLPDFPAEIRAPAGTVAGVSAFQVNFADRDVYTPGDQVNALIAMNPAAFKAHVADVEPGGIIVVDEDEFTKVNLRKAGYPEGYSPLDDEKYVQQYRVYRVPITRLNRQTLDELGLGAKAIGRSRNMFALGMAYWLFDRPLETTTRFFKDYYGDKKNMPAVAEANEKALKAGYYFGETAEIFPVRYHVAKAVVPAGRYRKVTGNEATAMGLVAATKLAKKDLVYCSYPITPASSILHSLASMRHFGVKTFQAEDEIAAICGAIGASFAGQLGACGTSGPGFALKAEALNLAVVAELPLVIVNVQRGGPSTGLPTKTEQADLLQTMFGRNSDSPVVILAPRSPADCFDVAIEAAHIAMTHMAPVVILSDGYLGEGAEPWKIPDAATLAPIKIEHPTAEDFENGFKPYVRDEFLARPWAIPGTPGLEHRIGGLEKEHETGNVSYDSENHQLMTLLRHEKINRVARQIPPLAISGEAQGDLLVLGWGGTYGAIATAVSRKQGLGLSVSAAHLRHLHPLPSNLGDVLRGFRRILIPELNMGQLRMLLRAKFLVDARGLNKIQGKPFRVGEIEQAIDIMMTDQIGDREMLLVKQHRVALDDQKYDFMQD